MEILVSRSFGDRLQFPYVIADPDVEMIEVSLLLKHAPQIINPRYLRQIGSHSLHCSHSFSFPFFVHPHGLQRNWMEDQFII